MQKLSGKSMVALYKSCRVFHQESKKIEFAFLWFFYDFIWIFQGSAIMPFLFKNQTARGSLELFSDSQVYHWFASKPLERLKALQCGPWPWPAAARPQFRRGARRTWPGKRPEGRGSSLATGLWPQTGRKLRRRGDTVVPDDSGCCGGNSSEETSGDGQHASGRARGWSGKVCTRGAKLGLWAPLAGWRLAQGGGRGARVRGTNLGFL
jgi:hypothetical protein